MREVRIHDAYNRSRRHAKTIHDGGAKAELAGPVDDLHPV